MKIYAVRDRLIDYFMTPFAAMNDRQVLASIATVINNEESKDAIAQAPHHFEIWELGTVQDNGHISSNPALIADCSSLIRRDLRKAAERREGSDGRPARNGESAPGERRGDTGPDHGPDEDTTHTAPLKAQETPPGPGGVLRRTGLID